MKLFLSHGLYGQRPSSHRDLYQMQPGWVFMELGSWTLELDIQIPKWARRVRSRLISRRTPT